jgi:ATP-dependent RNA helicase DDX19/DBP5
VGLRGTAVGAAPCSQDKIFPLCDKIGQTIIFLKTRDGCKRLMRTMNDAGYKCTAIEGGVNPKP